MTRSQFLAGIAVIGALSIGFEVGFLSQQGIIGRLSASLTKADNLLADEDNAIDELMKADKRLKHQCRDIEALAEDVSIGQCAFSFPDLK